MFQRRSSRQCESEALTSTGAGRDPAGLPEGGRLRFAPGPPGHRGGPNSVLDPPIKRRGPLAQPAGALTRGAPTPTAWIRGPAQQRGRPRSSRPPRRWPTQICTGAACPAAAQTVSWGRLTKEAALSHNRRAPSQEGRPRRRREYAALPSRGAGRDPAGLPEGGRLRFAPGPSVQRRPKQCPGAA